MKLRIATYNLNNLFRRPKLLQLAGFSPEAKAVLDDIDKVTGPQNEASDHACVWADLSL